MMSGNQTDKVGSRSIKQASGSHVAAGGAGGRGKGLALLPLAGLLLLLLLGLAAVLLAFNVLDEGDRSGLDFGNDKEASSTAVAPGTGVQPAPPTSQGGQAGQAGTSGPGNLVVGGRNILDEAAAGRLAQLSGQSAAGQSITVQSVVADEGFWVGQSDQSRVFVFLSPQAKSKPGESPFQVRAGQRIDLTGVVKPVPGDLTPLGVDQAEGSGQLRSQGHYVEANSVRLS